MKVTQYDLMILKTLILQLYTIFYPSDQPTTPFTSLISELSDMQPALERYRTGLKILPDEHNNPNFGYVVPDNFPRLFHHLDLVLSGIRSSRSILRAPLSKLRFCCQT